MAKIGSMLQRVRRCLCPGDSPDSDARVRTQRYVAAPTYQTNKHLPAPPRVAASSSTSSSSSGWMPPPPPPPPPSSLLPLLAALDGALSHIRYAVCGSTALQLWGMPMPPPPPAAAVTAASGRRRTNSSSRRRQPMPTICCPRATRDVLVAWAACTDLRIDRRRHWPDRLGLPCGGRGGVPASFVTVRVVWEEDIGEGGDGDDRVWSTIVPGGSGNEIWSTATVPGGNVPVLTLPALLHRAARAYALGTDAAMDPEVREALARDIFWILRRLRHLRRAARRWPVRLDTAAVPALWDPFFYDVFPRVYPEADRLFAAAGLPLPADEEDMNPVSGDSRYRVARPISKPLPPVPLFAGKDM